MSYYRQREHRMGQGRGHDDAYFHFSTRTGDHHESRSSFQGIFQNFHAGILCCFHQDIDTLFCMYSEYIVELMRNRESDHEVVDGKSFFQTLLNPFRNFMMSAFQAVPIAAGSVSDFEMPAFRTSAENTVSHFRDTAFHHIINCANSLSGIIVPPEQVVVVIAQNICEFRHKLLFAEVFRYFINRIRGTSGKFRGMMNVC